MALADAHLPHAKRSCESHLKSIVGKAGEALVRCAEPILELLNLRREISPTKSTGLAIFLQEVQGPIPDNIIHELPAGPPPLSFGGGSMMVVIISDAF